MSPKNEAYVVDAVRTAVGKRNGSLAGVHPVDLGALGWRGLLDRVDIDPAAVDDVIAGCVDAIGSVVPVSRRFPLARRRSWRALRM
jgi:acetyl-CoA C-acetyltransferase